MSSSTPYKSRLLNFLNRQAIQINDQLGKTIRYVKVATEWGVQILLYPVYLMVQSGRMVGRQLAQKLATNLFLPSSTETRENELEIPVDRPLASILVTISPWLIAPETNDISNQESIVITVDSNIEEINSLNLTTREIDSLLKPDLSLQGIASLLENRHLVLVDKNNQTLDILSLEQQQKIQKQIVLEVAIYKYQKRRQATLEKQQRMAYLPSYEVNSHANNIVAPVRLIWETVNWIQTSQIATSLDIFGESNLVYSTPSHPSENQISKILSSIDLAEIANSLDGTLVKLEDRTILPLRNKISDRLQALGQDWQNSPKNKAESGEIEADPFQIKAIILAAIKYFFGNGQDRVLTNNNSPQIKAFNNEIEEDTWLAWEDLYLSDRSQLAVKSKMPTPSPSLPAATMPKKPNNSAANKIKQDIERQKARSIPPISLKSSKLAKKTRSIGQAGTRSNSNIVSQKKVDRQNSSIQTKRDYLETEAKPVGYVKHPLEQILTWLDRAILWLEELFLAILRWLKR